MMCCSERPTSRISFSTQADWAKSIRSQSGTTGLQPMNFWMPGWSVGGIPRRVSFETGLRSLAYRLSCFEAVTSRLPNVLSLRRTRPSCAGQTGTRTCIARGREPAANERPRVACLRRVRPWAFMRETERHASRVVRQFRMVQNQLTCQQGETRGQVILHRHPDNRVPLAGS